MKIASLSIACLAALAVTSAANAAVVMYPTADTSVTRVNNATDQTVESSVSFAAADQFVDGQSGTPDVSRTRYYGGIYNCNWHVSYFCCYKKHSASSIFMLWVCIHKLYG